MHVYYFHGKRFTCWDLRGMLETDNFGQKDSKQTLQRIYNLVWCQPVTKSQAIYHRRIYSISHKISVIKCDFQNCRIKCSEPRKVYLKKYLQPNNELLFNSVFYFFRSHDTNNSVASLVTTEGWSMLCKMFAKILIHSHLKSISRNYHHTRVNQWWNKDSQVKSY